MNNTTLQSIPNPLSNFSSIFQSGNQHDMLKTELLYNRIGSDLANERTMLAWVRTMLACARTVFSYGNLLEPNSDPEAGGTRPMTVPTVTMMMATLLLFAGLNTGYRYWHMRGVLREAKAPGTYGRHSLLPFILLAVTVALITSIETYAGHWVY